MAEAGRALNGTKAHSKQFPLIFVKTAAANFVTSLRRSSSGQAYARRGGRGTASLGFWPEHMKLSCCYAEMQ